MPDESASASSGKKNLATHRRAFHDYHILEKFEAGLELKGAEVKSIREGRSSLQEGYARIENGQAYLYGLHVLPYAHDRGDTHEAARPKRLLLHKHEIHRLQGQVAVKGHTLIPLRLYLRHGRIKLELGLGKGKHALDKRETLKRKTSEREAQRAIANRGRK